MNNDLKKINKKEFVVFLFVLIISFCKGIGLSGSNDIYIALFILGFLLVLFKILTDKYTKKELLCIGSLMLIGVFNYVMGGTTTILFSAIIICCLKKIDVRKVIKIMLWTRVVAFIIMIFSSITGIIDGGSILHYREGYGFIERYCFGFSHPNLAHSSFAIILILYGYCYYGKINLVNVCLFLLANYILYTYTFSRAGFLLIIIYLFMLILYKNIKFFKKITFSLLKIALPIFVCLSIIFAMGYSKFEIIEKINTLLTGRIRYMNILIENYNFPIIGSDKYNEVVLFDNGYFSMIYEGGILATIWICYYYQKMNLYTSKKKMEKEAIFIITFLLYSMFESYFINALMNPTLILLGDYILNKDSEIFARNRIEGKDKNENQKN